MAPKAKRKEPLTLEYEGEEPPKTRLRPCNLLPGRPLNGFEEGKDLVAMVLDVVEEGGGRFGLWAATPSGASVHVRVADFHPYFYVAAPRRLVASQDDASVREEEYLLTPEALKELQGLLNRWMPPDGRLQDVEAVRCKPIMFYRPDKPGGDTFLKLSLGVGGNVKRASGALAKTLAAGRLRQHGLVWRDPEMYEGEVAPLQRFLADVPVAGGAWVLIPPAHAAAATATSRLGPASPPPAGGRLPPHLEAGRQAGQRGRDVGAAGPSSARQHAVQQGQAAGGYEWVPPESRVSSCCIEVVAPWPAIRCLSPDATQLADPHWSPFAPGETLAASEGARRAAEAAKAGDIAPLRMLLLDVVSGTCDGADRVAVAGKDPICAIACTLTTFHAAAAGHGGAAAEGAAGGAGATQAAVGGLREDENGDEEMEGAEALAGPATPSAAAPSRQPGQQLSVVFLLARDPSSAGSGSGASSSAARTAQGPSTPLSSRASRPSAGGQRGPGGGGGGRRGQGGAAWQRVREAMRELQSGAHVEVFDREDELLLSWLEFVRAADPDVLALFQVADTLEAARQRLAALGLEGGALHLSRMLRMHSKPMAIKKVTMYSAAWVRSQSRMSSTSNQETFRAEVDGRVVVDVLRQVLTGCNLASFSLVDCVQSLLGQTLEVLRPGQVSQLVGLAAPPPGAAPSAPALPCSPSGAGAEGAALSMPSAEAGALRLARYSMRRVGVVQALLHRLATIPETIEMARATGLTLGQVAYNAQMIRTWSLLLRTARRMEYVVAGRQDATPLSEHTFIMHPVEAGTVGLHKQPVAILDFASLYPSIYRAYNLCYTTLLHKDDQALFRPEQLTVTPTGAVFVKSEVRTGILPSILAALMEARGATRAQLKAADDPATRAVLDSRQKALKVTANAVYGFTGAQASMLQCVPLADSCLAYGAQSCRTAIQALQAAEAEGRLGPHGGGARIIYGHTDSLFVLFPNARDALTAIQSGKLASREVSRAFPPPMELKFERVCLPLMLLHVNRYAGRAYEREEEAAAEGGGTLIVKGLKSMWRQAAPIVRTTLHGALVRILMQDDVRGAVSFVEGEVRRLLAGRVSLYELIMTGGLWRVTGQQVEKAAAGEAPAAGVPPEEEVRGPHAALAVRLSQRDPGRGFVLGERLQYVLVAGERLQEDAAEDPLTAARAGAPPDYELYWRNKLQRPLQELFATCLPPQQLQSLMNGPHTMVKVEQLAPQQPPGGAGSPGAKGKLLSPGGSRGRQAGLTMFFQQTPKCLGCRRNLPGYKEPLDQAPGLCAECSGIEGRWEGAYLSLLEEQSAQDARLSAAEAACRRCHSGTVGQDTLCLNAECPAMYARLGARARVQAQQRALARMDIF